MTLHHLLNYYKLLKKLLWSYIFGNFLSFLLLNIVRIDDLISQRANWQVRSLWDVENLISCWFMDSASSCWPKLCQYSEQR